MRLAQFAVLGAVSLALIPAASCKSSMPDLRTVLGQPNLAPDQEWHVGPDVHVAPTGPARFAQPLYDAFDMERARELTEFIDGFYRAPANEGYDKVVDRVVDDLVAAGFEEGQGRLRWEIITGPPETAWTPVSAELVLLADGEKARTLHAFSKPGDVDRAMLPVNSPACDVEGEVAFHLDQVKKGMILVTDVSASQVLRRAQARGAAAVISASLADFNEDLSGQERHLDAIQFRTLSVGNRMPVAQISRKTLLLIEEASERAVVRNRGLRLSFKAEVVLEERPMRTLVATIMGAERPDEAFAMVSHIQELGACDNASGVAGLLEGARSLAELLEAEKLPWPQRSLVFIWGDEFRQTSTWLEHTDLTPVAGISSDMTGQSKDTGARALLERTPDPGAIFTLPPDAHTPWGAGEVDSENLKPSGLAIIARCAMIDVGLIDLGQVDGGDWHCADHPWEGGSDHDVFNAQGVPAVLFWHFTDFTYHTSLDRMEFLDPAEMRRTGVAILATALAVADPEPGDLDRYLQSLAIEEQVRVAAAEDVENEQLVALWRLWCRGARNWLRQECLGIDENLPDDKDN